MNDPHESVTDPTRPEGDRPNHDSVGHGPGRHEHEGHSTQGGCLSGARAPGGKPDSGGTPLEARDTECNGLIRSATRNETVCNGMRHPDEAHDTECDGLIHPDDTECDGLIRNETVCKNGSEPQSYFARISTRKQAAIRHLIEGASVAETARRISAGRSTVSRWINHDFTFQMALEEKLRVIWSETAVGMAAHARKAVARPRGGKLAEMLDATTAQYTGLSGVCSPA